MPEEHVCADFPLKSSTRMPAETTIEAGDMKRDPQMGNATALENVTSLAIPLKRSKTVLKPDPSRVLLRQFEPGDARRMRGIIERIMAVPESMFGMLLEQVSPDFPQPHLTLRQRFSDRFEQLQELLPPDAKLSEQRRLLIGSYFLAEYSLESA